MKPKYPEYAILDIANMKWYKGMALSGNWKMTNDFTKAALMKKKDAVGMCKRSLNFRVVRL